MAVLEVTDRFPEVAKALKALTQTEILVGIPNENMLRKEDYQAAKATRAAGGSAPEQPFSNAAIAYIAENGSALAHIPPRPFMAAGIAIVRVRVAKLFEKAGLYAMAGQITEMDKTLHAIGLVAATGMKQAIQDGGFAPLAPRTLAARRARGRTGEKPLLDTGQLRNAISYILRKKSGGDSAPTGGDGL